MKTNFLSIKAQTSISWKMLRRPTRHQITATKHSDAPSLNISETDGLTSSWYFTQMSKNKGKAEGKRKLFHLLILTLENFENSQYIQIQWFYYTEKLTTIIPFKNLTKIYAFKNTWTFFIHYFFTKEFERKSCVLVKLLGLVWEGCL